MLIDCDTCTVRGRGCHDCVVTVLLGAPPGWRGSDPTVVPLTRRPASAGPGRGAGRGAIGGTTGGTTGLGSTGHPGGVLDTPGSTADLGDALVSGPAVVAGGTAGTHRGAGPGVVVELDEVERRAVRALAEVGLVPPLRHRPPATRVVG